MATTIELAIKLSADAARKQVSDLNSAIQKIRETEVDINAPADLGKTVADVAKLATSYDSAREAIAATIVEQKKIAAALALSGDTTSEAYKSAIAEIKRSTAEIQKMDAALDGVNQSADKTSKKFSTLEFNALRESVDAVAGSVVSLSQPFVALDTSVRNIGALGVKNFGELGGILNELSLTIPNSAAEIGDGLAEAIGSGVIKTQENGEVLRGEVENFAKLTGQLAVSGGASFAEATKAVAAVQNSYQLSASELESTATKLFNTFNVGSISVQELGQYIAQVTPSAAGLGIPMEELGGAIATMTKAGLGASDTMTKLKALMTEVQKPGKELEKVMGKAGLSVDLLKKPLDQGGITLQEFIKRLNEAGGANLAAVFSSVEAKDAVAIIGNASSALQDLADVAKEGTIAEGFAVQQESVANQAKLMQNAIDAFTINVLQNTGSAGAAFVAFSNTVAGIGPQVTALAGLKQILPTDAISGATEKIKSAFSTIADDGTKSFLGVGNAVKLFATNINQTLLSAVAKIAPTLVTTNAAGATSFVGLGTAARAAWAAVTGPVGLVVAGIGALGAAVVAAYKYWDDFRVTVDSVWNAIKSLGDDVIPLLQEIGSVVVSAVKLPFELISTVVAGVGSLLSQWLAPTKDAGKELFSIKGVLDVVRGVIDTIRASIAGIQQGFAAVKKTVSNTFDSLLKGDVQGVFDAVAVGAKETQGVLANFNEGFDLKKLAITFDREYGKLPDIAQKYTDRIKDLQKDGLTTQELDVAKGVLQRQLDEELVAAGKLTALTNKQFGITAASAVERAKQLTSLSAAEKKLYDEQLKKIDEFNGKAKTKYQLSLSELVKSTQGQRDQGGNIPPKIDDKAKKKAQFDIEKFAQTTSEILAKSGDVRIQLRQGELDEARRLLIASVRDEASLTASLQFALTVDNTKINQQIRSINEEALKQIASVTAELDKQVKEGALSRTEADKQLTERSIAINEQAQAQIAKTAVESRRKSNAEQLQLEQKLVADLVQAGKLSVTEASNRLTEIATKRKEEAQSILAATGQSAESISSVIAAIDSETAKFSANLVAQNEARLAKIAELEAQYGTQRISAEGQFNKVLQKMRDEVLGNKISQFDVETEAQKRALETQLNDLFVSEEQKAQILTDFAQKRADARVEIERNANNEIIGIFGNATADILKAFKEFTTAYKIGAVAEATIATYLGATKAYGQGGILGIAAAAGIIAAGLANVAKIIAVNPGYEDGGFTRKSSRNDEVAGVVHANEFVANAQLTSANRQFFEDLHKSGNIEYAMSRSPRLAKAAQMSNLVVDNTGHLRRLERQMARQVDEVRYQTAVLDNRLANVEHYQAQWLSKVPVKSTQASPVVNVTVPAPKVQLSRVY